MGELPARPKSVPPKAVWNADDGEWELGTKSPRGERSGAFKFFRKDGTLCNECTFKDGRPSGPFKRYHNNGKVSQEGKFVEGQLDGVRTWFACDEPSDEETLTEGLSPKVRRSEMVYEKGKAVTVRHFDAEDNQVLPSGEPCPERPPMVPDEAEYQPGVGWVIAILDPQGRRNGSWQKWDDAGVLVESCTYVHNLRHGLSTVFHPNGQKAEEGAFEQGQREGVWREFDPKGLLVTEITWRSGARHGPAVDRNVAGLYADPAIAVERGSFEDDHATGPWSLQDTKGKTVVRRDLGVRVDDDAVAASPALVDEGKTAEGWRALGATLRESRRFGEAILCEARAAAADGDPASLVEATAATALPRASTHAAEIAAQVARSEVPLPVLVNLLVRGAAAGPVLRAMAAHLDQKNKSRAALDFVNAAILLEPEQGSYLFTRALILMSLGLPQMALQDANEREAQDEKQGRFLVTYANALFAHLDFWPAKDKPWTDYDDLPEGPAQQGARVRVVVLKYLTRLCLLREAQQAWLKPGVEPEWLVPALESLLPAGKVKLEQYEFDLKVEDGSTHQVKVDEQLELDSAGLPDLLRIARADWMALTWLCWACGLAEVGLPKALSAPAEFGQAAGMSLQRLWRVRDKRLTGGAVAKREKAPGFAWEGVDIDELDAGLVSMPESEYAEMAAMFRWLTNERAKSPWQDNLRDS